MNTRVIHLCLFRGVAVGTVNAVRGVWLIDKLFEQADVIVIGSLRNLHVDCSMRVEYEERGQSNDCVERIGSRTVDLERLLVGSLGSEKSVRVSWSMLFDLAVVDGSQVGQRAVWFIRTSPRDPPIRIPLDVIVLSYDEAVAQMIRQLDKLPPATITENMNSERRVLVDAEQKREARTE